MANERYCAVFLSGNKEIGRSKPMSLDDALKIVRRIHKERNVRMGNAARHAYVEEASTVKHLPIKEM